MSRRLLVTLIAAVTVAALGGAGIGYAASAATGPAIRTSTPRSERDITNIDVLRQQIRNYYGDPLGTGTFASDPNYLKEACAGDPNGSCTTIHYKSATRAHIQSLGYEIVANFGDQYSDLEGGHADRTFKLPNPNYFLP